MQRQVSDNRRRGARRAVLALGLVAVTLLCPHGWLSAAGEKPPDALSLAWAALSDDRFAVAVELLEPLMMEAGELAEPAAAALLDSMARAYYGAGSVGSLTNLLAGTTGPLVGYWQGRLALDAGDADTALTLVDAALTTAAQAAPLHLTSRLLRLKAWALIGREDSSAAIAALEACLAADDQSPEMARARSELARLLLAAGEPARALAVLPPASSAAPAADDPDAWLAAYLRAEALHRLDRSAAAMALLTELRQSDLPPVLQADALVLIGRIQTATNGYAAAIATLGAALKEAPDAAQRDRARLALVEALVAAGRPLEAAALVKQRVAIRPDGAESGELLLTMGDVLRTAGNHAAALTFYDQFLGAMSDSDGVARAHAGRALALEALARFSEAAHAFGEAASLQTGVQREANLYRAADCHFNDERFKAAGDAYGTVLAEFPAGTMGGAARFQQALCLIRRGLLPEASELLLAVAGGTHDATLRERAMVQLADVAYQSGEWALAEERYVLALDSFEEGHLRPEALYGRGLARYALWKPAALVDFDRVITTAPGHALSPHAGYMRLLCLDRLGRHADALLASIEFETRFPDSTLSPRVHFWTGQQLYNAGEFEQAEAAFVAFATEFKEDALADDALLRAGMAAAQRRDYRQANVLLGKVGADFPGRDSVPAARFQQGDALTRLGEYEAAILLFDELIQNYPASELVPSAWGRKGDCQFTLGVDAPARYEEAITSYRVVTKMRGGVMAESLQAEYKIGRCLRRLGREAEAVDHLYGRVMQPFLSDDADATATTARRVGTEIWFVRASLDAAEMLEQREEWRQLVKLLTRVAHASVSISPKAAQRADQIRRQHWWLLY